MLRMHALVALFHISNLFAVVQADQDRDELIARLAAGRKAREAAKAKIALTQSACDSGPDCGMRSVKPARFEDIVKQLGEISESYNLSMFAIVNYSVQIPEPALKEIYSHVEYKRGTGSTYKDIRWNNHLKDNFWKMFHGYSAGDAEIGFMGPGTYYSYHSDTLNRSCRCHMPVSGFSHAELRLGVVVPPREKGLMYCGDFTYPHAAWNAGDTMRVHLMIEARLDHKPRNPFQQAVAEACSSVLGQPEMKTAKQLAVELVRKYNAETYAQDCDSRYELERSYFVGDWFGNISRSSKNIACDLPRDDLQYQ